jgi:hypothetical protein
MCDGASARQKTEGLLNGEGRDGGGGSREGSSSLQELGGVFFKARSTKSLTTNAKRRAQVQPFRPENLHEYSLCWRVLCSLMGKALSSACV